MEKEKFHSKKAFINKLKRVIESLSSEGKFIIQIKKKRIVVPSSAKVSIQYEQDKNDRELEFQFSWKEQTLKTKNKK